MHTPGRRLPLMWVWPLPRLVVVLVVAAFAAWEGIQGRFSTGSHASILATIGALLVLALTLGRASQRKRSAAWLRDAARAIRRVFVAGSARTASVAGSFVWLLLIGATIGWDAASFLKQKRDLPTLSRLLGDVTNHEWGRALVFAAWLALGLYLAAGWRRRHGAPDLANGPARRRAGGSPGQHTAEEDGVP